MRKSGLDVVVVGALWGVMYALYPLGLRHASPAWLAAARFLVFFVGALAAALVLRVPLRVRSARDWWAILAYAAFNVVLHNLGLMAATQRLPVAAVSLLTALNPVLTLLLVRATVPGTRASPTTWTGLALGLAGLAVLDLRGGAAGARLPWDGLALALLGVGAWAVGSVAVKAADATLPPLALCTWAALIGYVTLQATALVTAPVPPVDSGLVVAASFAGLGGGLAAFLVWIRIVRRDGPQRANLATYVSPVVASLAAIPLAQQGITWVHGVAYVLVALGLTVALRGTRGTTPVAPAAAE